jgi:hypothetical protein
MMADPAPGARWLEVAPERLSGWVTSFAARHGQVTAEPSPEILVLRALDGAVAECYPPFPPLAQPAGTAAGPAGEQEVPGPAGVVAAADPVAAAQQLAAHATTDRTVGVLLVRLGGYAAGVFTGSPPRLVAARTGSRLVHGRSAAGGWSQQRFARRREKQAAAALAAAADTAAAVIGPYAARLDALVLGGDRRAVATVTADPRLRPVLRHAVERFLVVPDPRLAVLRDTARRFRAIRIRLTERTPGDGTDHPEAT